MRRALVRKLSINSALRGLVRLADTVLRFSLRVWSRLRFSALVANAQNSVCDWSTEIKYPENILLGNHVIIGPQCCLGAMASIKIGDYARISRGVIIETAGLDLDSELPYSHLAKPIVIGKGVWLATNAVVLGGVTVGDYAVVGAGVVVTKDVPPYSIVVGCGSRILKKKRARDQSVAQTSTVL
jgi:acetyltransferase-like isoleucine patch superfamily enzyme